MMEKRPARQGDVEAGAAEGEKQPLLGKDGEGSSPSSGRKRSLIERAKSKIGHLQEAVTDTEEVERVMEYETYHLGTWQTLFYINGTIWRNTLLWTMVGRLLLVSLVVGVVIFCISADPTSIQSSKFQQVSGLLKVFVGFLLGFFLTSSVNRWGEAVSGFLSLCNAIKNLVMMLHALGAPHERIDKVKRYGILSAEFLVLEMRVRTNHELKQQEVIKMLDKFVEDGSLSEDEAAVLVDVKDHAALMWVWVVSLISRASQDQEVPNMASPTYGRLVMLANSAEEGIRQVRVASKVQLPFVYVHTLALLVHINNLLCAVGFGCTVGTSIAAILARLGLHIWGRSAGPDEGSIAKDVQSITMAFVTSFVVPLMYQAFLQIGLLLAQPFDNPSSSISAVPASRMIAEMQRELVDQEKMANSTKNAGWEKPCFMDAGKPPPAKASAATK